MPFTKSLLILYLYFYTSVGICKELPSIYISPNPSKENINLHAGNVEYINLSNDNINFSLSNIQKIKQVFHLVVLEE